MKVLTETLWMAGCSDQVNTPALASLEMISRRICQLVEAYAGGDPGKPNWDGVRYLAPSLTHTSVVPTALRSYAQRRLKEEIEMDNSRVRRSGGGSPAIAVTADVTEALGSPSARPGGGKGDGKKGSRRLAAAEGA